MFCLSSGREQIWKVVPLVVPSSNAFSICGEGFDASSGSRCTGVHSGVHSERLRFSYLACIHTKCVFPMCQCTCSAKVYSKGVQQRFAAKVCSKGVLDVRCMCWS